MIYDFTFANNVVFNWRHRTLDDYGPHAYLELQSPADAYESVLANAGATLPRRDAVDRRIIEMVRTGKATAKASTNAAQEGYSFP